MTEQQNPYVGLRPFFLKDSLQFFGRETQTAELLAVLRQHQFLGVVGSSGSGKSSLVRAGLLPALFGGFLVGDRDRWRVVQIKPGDTPIRNLAAGLLAAFSETPPADAEIAALEASIGDDQADAVIAFVKARLTPRESVFLLVDQFEELFAFRRAGDDERAEAADFVALLMALAQGTSGANRSVPTGQDRTDVPVFVALTMRTDFLGDCDLFYGLPEILNRGQYLVPRLTRQQLRLAIEGPAMLTGARVAPQLMDLLLNQLGDREDRLPVIQHALLRTWDAWHASGATGPIEVRHFAGAGGLENALNIDAEAALAEVKTALPTVDDNVIARVFKALTDTDLSHRAVRRPARMTELMAAAGADRVTVDTVIRCFSHKNRSFLHADGWPGASDPRVDISHESLIRQWTRLREWVDQERAVRDQFTALVVRARSWQTHGVVLQGNELKSADAWWTSAQPSAAWARRYAVQDDDFAVAQDHLTASKKARWRTKVAWAVSAAVLVTAVAGTLTYMQRSQAKTAFETELLRDMENHATSLLERDPESAIVAGLIAAETHAGLYPGADLPVALETILLRAWQESALVKTQHLAFEGDADYAELSPDARVVLLGGASAVDGENGVKAYDVGTGRLLASLGIPSFIETACAAFSANGGHFNLSVERASLRWSLSTGDVEEVSPLTMGDGRRLAGCLYSPDATRMALVSRADSGLDWVLTLAKVSDQRITKVRDIRLAPKAEHLTALRFSRNGDGVAVALAISDADTRVRVFDVRTGGVLKRFTTANRVTDLAFSRAENVIVTVEDAFTYGLFVRGFDNNAAPSILPNSARDDDYSGIVLSSDGQRLAAVNGDTASLWDVSTGLDIGSFKGHQRAILGMAFDQEGRLVTVGQDADIRHWRAGTREKRAVQPEVNLHSAAFSPMGTFVIAAGTDGRTTGWSVDQPERPFPAKLELSTVFHMVLSLDGRLLAATTDGSMIAVLDTQSGRRLAELDGGSVRARLALSPNGKRLALADDEHVQVWTLPSIDAQPFRPSEPLAIGSAIPIPQFQSAAFSLDEAGRQIATINGPSIFLWNASTGGCEGRIDTLSPVFSMAYTPDGGQIATGDGLGRVSFWNLFHASAGGCEARAKADRIRPDTTFQEHHQAVRAITFPADGSRFATASDDRTAKVWDTKTGRVLLTFRHARAVTDAAFSSDGRLLMTTVDDQGAKVWDIPVRAEILSSARSRLTRKCLSKDERQRFFPGMPVDNPPCVTVGR